MPERDGARTTPTSRRPLAVLRRPHVAPKVSIGMGIGGVALLAPVRIYGRRTTRVACRRAAGPSGGSVTYTARPRLGSAFLDSAARCRWLRPVHTSWRARRSLVRRLRGARRDTTPAIFGMSRRECGAAPAFGPRRAVSMRFATRFVGSSESALSISGSATSPTHIKKRSAPLWSKHVCCGDRRFGDGQLRSSFLRAARGFARLQTTSSSSSSVCGWREWRGRIVVQRAADSPDVRRRETSPMNCVQLVRVSIHQVRGARPRRCVERVASHRGRST